MFTVTFTVVRYCGLQAPEDEPGLELPNPFVLTQHLEGALDALAARRQDQEEEQQLLPPEAVGPPKSRARSSRSWGLDSRACCGKLGDGIVHG